MSESPEQIESHIRHTREDLSANLNELEQKVKSAADWRHHFAKSPVAFLAAAVGGGVLLALATRGPPSRSSAYPPPVRRPDSVPAGPRVAGQFDASIGVIKGALIGLAADQAKNVLAKLLPGFEAQLADQDKPKAARRPGAPPPPRPNETDGASNIG